MQSVGIDAGAPSGSIVSFQQLSCQFRGSMEQPPKYCSSLISPIGAALKSGEHINWKSDRRSSYMDKCHSAQIAEYTVQDGAVTVVFRNIQIEEHCHWSSDR